MIKTTILKEAWELGRTKKFIHLINSAFAAGMAFVYFETFIFAFGNGQLDSNMANAVIMIKIIATTLFILRALTYLVERLSIEDELDQIIRKDTRQLAYFFLVITIIGSLLSWSVHKNAETVFHFVFFSVVISYTLFHFISSIKYMKFMAKPSLFELDSEN